MKKIISILCLLFYYTFFMSQAKKPSLMIVPAKDWCFENNYTKTYDNEGTPITVSDYDKALLNPDLNNIITKIGGLMSERDFPLKDLQASLTKIRDLAAEDAMLTSKQGGEVNESPLDLLKKTAKADIIIYISWQLNDMGFDKSVTFRIRALDAYTDKQVAEATGTGEPSMTAEIAILLEEAVLEHIDNFNASLMNHFDDMFNNGREVILRIKTWDSWDYDLETEEFGDDELGILIEDWMSDNTVAGKFNTVDATESMMLFEQVRIPLYYERKGQQRALDARRWAKGLQKYLRTDFEIQSKLMMRGLGQAQLVLGEK